MLLYNLCTASSYTFDFEKWFSNFDINSNIIKHWKKTILQAYTSYKNTIIKFDGKDFFQYPLNLGYEHIFLHLDMRNIRTEAYSNSSTYTLKLSEISSNIWSQYIYSPANTYNHHHLSSNVPIIFCPFPSYLGVKYITIDGNHRVTAKKKNNVSTIRAVCYVPTSIKDFSNEFEFQIYSFIKFMCFD